MDFLYKPLDPHILRSKAEVFHKLHRQKQQLDAHLREMEDTLRLNEVFAAVLGHDLRNPLSAIIASAHLLRRSDDQVAREAGEAGAEQRSPHGAPDRGPAGFLARTTGRRHRGAARARRSVRPGAARGAGTRGERGRSRDRAGSQWFAARPLRWPSAWRRWLPTSSATPCSMVTRGKDPRAGGWCGRIAPAAVGEQSRRDTAASAGEIFQPFRGRHSDGDRARGWGWASISCSSWRRAHGGEVDVVTGGGTTRFTVLLPRVPAGLNRAQDSSWFAFRICS